ncbi:MAG: trypsin-like peptidase domain-containing protein [Synechococcus sp.]|nr:trypsin-like peptidase domain-containing protein [Synechococcus sp.]
MSRHRPALDAEAVFRRRADAVVVVELPDGMGAGVLLDRSGLIATSHHLIEGWSHAEVRLRDGTRLTAPVVRSFRGSDLAFLQLGPVAAPTLARLPLPPEGERLPGVRLPRIGEAVYVIGHPLGLEYTLTQGIVSGVEREIEGRRFLQIDAAINPGNSGGPLYDRQAELVGIIACTRLESEGLSFAVPADQLQRLWALHRSEQRSGPRQYCAVCGAASLDLRYCDQCGSLLARVEVSGEDESIEEKPLEEGAHAPAPLEETEREPEADPPAACPVCGAPCGEGQRYCAVCGATL